MSTSSNVKRKLSVLLIAPALLLAFTACASSPGGSSPSAGGPSPRATSASDWRVAFAGCMRDQGIDIPDPGTGGNSGTSIDSSNQDALLAAAKKCQAQLGPMPALSQAEQDAQNAQLQKAMLAAAKCLRDNGVDVADPKPGETLKVPDTAPQDIRQKCGADGAQGATTSLGG
ncbi:hypothetical protein ACFPJ4_10185 [Lysinimonas soli]|uniref:Secreted protein n=1 Tax=Lysinimonas soli TaxID=1074233 RepID=A0ABW0NQF3_9MICO